MSAHNRTIQICHAYQAGYDAGHAGDHADPDSQPDPDLTEAYQCGHAEGQAVRQEEPPALHLLRHAISVPHRYAVCVQQANSNSYAMGHNLHDGILLARMLERFARAERAAAQ